jgi:hypothetical protein
MMRNANLPNVAESLRGPDLRRYVCFPNTTLILFGLSALQLPDKELLKKKLI